MKIERFVNDYNGEKFDVVVIGGGITGASVAYEAASRGLSVALVEKNDFAGATSSATSKMIHGGLRYLAKGEVGLVRESLRERRIMSIISPNFVYPYPFIMTLYKKDKVPAFFMKMGMLMYEILSYDKNRVNDPSLKIPHYKNLSAKEVKKLEPIVKDEGLVGGSLYYDCADHSPERLTLAFIKSAIKYGAKVANYTEMKNYISTKSSSSLSINGVQVIDKLTGKEIDINADLVINCSGPWADIILGRARNKPDKHMIRRSEGIHIVYPKLVNDYIIGSTTHDNKHFFLVPYRNKTLIGTTDQEYKGNPDEYKVTKEAIEVLIDTVNTFFGKELIQYDKILFTYGGLRPLVEDQTEDVYKSSRKYEITDEKKNGITGLMTIEGGKYTTSRRLAEKAIDKAFHMLGKEKKKSISENQFLYGSDIPDFNKLVEENKKKYLFLNDRQVMFLTRMYGTELDLVMKIGEENEEYLKPLNEDGENLAQVVYSFRHEAAKSILDVLIRRTGIGQLGHPGKEIMQKIIEIAKKELGWNEQEIQLQLGIAEQRLQIPQ